MATELFPSSFRCDCGQELVFFEGTISNMKKMYDQIDLWMMENNTDYPDDGGATLVAEQYIREIPICPSGNGLYTIEAYASNMSITITCPNLGANPDHVMQGD